MTRPIKAVSVLLPITRSLRAGYSYLFFEFPRRIGEANDYKKLSTRVRARSVMLSTDIFNFIDGHIYSAAAAIAGAYFGGDAIQLTITSIGAGGEAAA